jgi:hypothetical protein
MELQIYQPTEPVLLPTMTQYHMKQHRTPAKPFLEANTNEVQIQHLKSDCTIPVFAKDNERTISHQEFIQAAQEAAGQLFGSRFWILRILLRRVRSAIRSRRLTLYSCFVVRGRVLLRQEVNSCGDVFRCNVR